MAALSDSNVTLVNYGEVSLQLVASPMLSDKFPLERLAEKTGLGNRSLDVWLALLKSIESANAGRHVPVGSGMVELVRTNDLMSPVHYYTPQFTKN